MVWRLTHVDGGREDLRLREHSEAIAQLGHVVVGLLRICVNRLHALEGNHWIKLVRREGSGARVNRIEDSVENARLDSSRRGKTLVLLRHSKYSEKSWANLR